jgi:cobalt/nickel transport system ATP-binding protein
MAVNETLKNDPAVAFEDLSYSYPDGFAALSHISCAIAAGEKTGVIGGNGAGKSTFLCMLNGLLQGSGSIRIFGKEVNRANLTEIRSLVGLVFQNPDDQLFCPTILEDVAFGPFNQGLDKEAVLMRCRQALDEVGLSGYEHRSSLRLSFGEKKLAAIAAILSMQPEIIAMDEPSSNLDPKHRRRIIHWLSASSQTCIVTSHDLDMIRETCRRVLLLNAGKLVADGEAETILSDQKLLEANGLELPLSLIK